MCRALPIADTGSVKLPSASFVLRWAIIMAVIGCTAQFSVQGFFHSTVFKKWMYQRLISGNEKQQLRAASALVYVRAEKYLLAALKLNAPNTRDLAKRALEFAWFTAAGEQAEKKLGEAVTAANEERYQEALEALNKLIAKYPTFAEAWNQRAAVYWKRAFSGGSLCGTSTVGGTLRPSRIIAQ